MKPYPGLFYTGDGAARDEHGYIWIKGRIDGAYLLTGSPFVLCSLSLRRCYQRFRTSSVDG